MRFSVWQDKIKTITGNKVCTFAVQIAYFEVLIWHISIKPK
ncbi:hypothetical protein VIRA109638_00925 [Vibrio rarus]